MRKTFVILLGILFFGLAGCSDKSSDTLMASDASAKTTAKQVAPSSKKVVSATNRVTTVESVPGVTPEELAHVRACFGAIDDGREAFAMRHARELMGSTNVEVRLMAIEAFGWIGRFAIKELTEMMADEDEEVCSEAVRQWEMAFEDISSTIGKIQAIESAALALKKQSSLEAVMMKLTSIEDHNAVKVLCNIITSPKVSPVAAEVAREEYASLAGEPFLDAKRAEQVVTNLKNQADGIASEQPKGQPSKTQQRSETK